MAHTVLAVPVPELDDLVRERTAFYDPSFVSRDPEFIHSHITVLGPWILEPSERDLATVADIAASIEPTRVTFVQVLEFPNGLIYLQPESDELFRKLTAALAAEYPGYPPYAGEFPDPVPHLTLDHAAGGVALDDVRARVAGYLPTTFIADRLDLQWWANNDCRLLHSWSLGGDESRVHISSDREANTGLLLGKLPEPLHAGGNAP